MDEYPAWVVSRWLAGKPVENIQPERFNGSWREILGVVYATNGGDRKAAFQKYIAHRPGISAEKIWGEIMHADPNKPMEETTERRGLYQVQAAMLPLPDECYPADKHQAAIDDAGHFYNDYLTWANDKANRSSPNFNGMGALFTIALTVARRVVLRLAHGDVWPNLYALGIAPPALYGKTVSLDCSREIIESAIPHLLMERDLTPEAMMETLSGKLPANFDELPDQARAKREAGRRFSGQRGQLMDEAATLFNGFEREYKSDLRELYLAMYECNQPFDRLTKQSGVILVPQPYLSFYGMTTTRHFKKMIGAADDWGTGLWSRFLLLAPTVAPRYTELREHRLPCPPALVARVRQLADQLPAAQLGEPLQALEAHITTPAFEGFRRYDRALWHMTITKGGPEENIHPSYVRHSTKALKTALLFAIMDWPGGDVAVQITAAHWYKAQAIAEDWRNSLHRLLAFIATNGLDSREMLVLERLEQNPDGLSLRDIYRPLGINSQEAEKLIQSLMRDGIVEVRQITPAGGGRPTQKFFSTGLA